MTPRRTDGNQAAIAAALRRIGATVQDIHEIGKGCPDLLVGYHGRNWLIECKMPGEQLTSDESRWHYLWCGRVDIVCSPLQAVRLLTEIEQP